jgi:hypothetical protein
VIGLRRPATDRDHAASTDLPAPTVLIQVLIDSAPS